MITQEMAAVSLQKLAEDIAWLYRDVYLYVYLPYYMYEDISKETIIENQERAARYYKAARIMLNIEIIED